MSKTPNFLTMTVVADYVGKSDIRINDKSEKWKPTLDRINEFARKQLDEAKQYFEENKTIKDRRYGSNE